VSVNKLTFDPFAVPQGTLVMLTVARPSMRPCHASRAGRVPVALQRLLSRCVGSLLLHLCVSDHKSDLEYFSRPLGAKLASDIAEVAQSVWSLGHGSDPRASTERLARPST
jgi:hypothetical protein